MSIFPMTLRLLKTASLLALISVPALLSAQTETTGKEEERLEALARSQGEWYVPKTKISVGFRFLNSGGKVDFGNLGEVATQLAIVPVSSGAVTRSYANGTVEVDALRANEKDADGNQTSTPGGRYDVFTTTTVNVVDADGVVTGTQDVVTRTGDLLSYTAGLTRVWFASTEGQLSTPGYVSFSIYDVTSGGGSASHKQGANGGVEFQFSREIGHGTSRLQWGLIAGITLNGINSKSAGTVSSTLHTQTDYYSLNGQVITAVHLTNPSTGDILDSDGNVLVSGGLETTAALNALPDGTLSTNLSTTGGANVDGNWQVKGSYFMVKFGPSIRTQITDRLGLTASLGLAGAYAGTRYSAYEAYTLTELPGVTFDTTESSTMDKFLHGYYADVNLEWTANETLGLFGGVTAQQLSAYEQKLGNRTAKIDLGSAVGIRGGVSIKF